MLNIIIRLNVAVSGVTFKRVLIRSLSGGNSTKLCLLPVIYLVESIISDQGLGFTNLLNLLTTHNGKHVPIVESLLLFTCIGVG